MKQLVFLLLISLFPQGCFCAMANKPEAQMALIRNHSVYKTLDDESKELIEEIMKKAVDSPKRNYYFYKLRVLLSTPVKPKTETAKMNKKVVKKTIERIKQKEKEVDNWQKYNVLEESYELSKKCDWDTYSPEWWGTEFYVCRDDPTDILINVRVKLNGKREDIEQILYMEDAIEKHLAIPGFSVNLMFVGVSGKDVFEVKVNMEHWPSSHNWSGSYMALAHELMHLFGLPDEYDRIKSHADNPNLTIKQRLYQFIYQMDDELPDDATSGIMCYSSRKPLNRHVCAAVGLGDKCIKARNNMNR